MIEVVWWVHFRQWRSHPGRRSGSRSHVFLPWRQLDILLEGLEKTQLITVWYNACYLFKTKPASQFNGKSLGEVHGSVETRHPEY